MNRAIRLLGVLVSLAATVACSAPASDETGASTEESALATTTPVGALTLSDGTSLSVLSVSTPTTAALTKLPLGSASTLIVRMPVGDGVARLFAESGTRWTMALGGQTYELGATSLSGVSFSAVDKSKGKGNVYITVSFKPTEIKYMKASGDVAKPSPKTRNYTTNDYRAAFGAAASGANATIDAWSVDANGRGSFTLHIAAADIGAWNAWPSSEARSGSITYQGTSGSLVVALDKVTKEKPVRDDSLQFYTVKCYTEHTKLTMTKTDA